MCHALKGRDPARAFWISSGCHPQTIAVVRTRADALGIRVRVGCHEEFDFAEGMFGVLVQYPATDGSVVDFRPFVEQAHAQGALVIAAADLLALTLLTPPGEWGAIYRTTDPHSFPSGHAARSVLLAILLTAWGPAWAAPLAILWAPLVALARVSLGVHYLSDVVAGGLLGLAAALVAVTVSSP